MIDNDYLTKLTEILLTTTYKGWARSIPTRDPDLYNWIKNKTIKYNPVNFMESIYIIKNDIIPPICSQGNKCRFISYSSGYQRSCSQKCKCFKELSASITIKNQEKYSKEKWHNINNKVTQSCLEKYGAIRATSKKSNKFDEIQQQSKETNLEKYGYISFNKPGQRKICSELGLIKRKKSCLTKYGVEFPLQSKEIRDKSKNTNLKIYGVENPIHNKDLKQKAYDSQVKSGKYTNPLLKDDWEIYKGLSHFKGSINNFIHTVEQWKLFEKTGLFNSRSNKDGLVRDHMFSRRHGFDYKIFPEIIRHPANCRLITHRENAGKGYSSIVSLEELFENILGYTKIWHEQKTVINLIQLCIKGEHWINPYKIKEKN